MEVIYENNPMPDQPGGFDEESGAEEPLEVIEAIEDEDLEPVEANPPLPMVAVIGRPNVGKSTLFNRIVGRRLAVVHDRPGVTRDRNIARAEWEGVEFNLVDTGGFETELDDPLLEEVVEQVRLAMDEADAIIWLTSVPETSHPADLAVVELLRRAKKPVLMAVNKCDNQRLSHEAQGFYEYGFDPLYPIAAMHGVGVGDLLSDLVAFLRKVDLTERAAQRKGRIALALVGRQNAGKSTLVNQLAGAQRVIASSVPGTTRDAIDLDIEGPGGVPFKLIDTAGIRRRGKIERGIEKVSVLYSLMALERADVGALLIDATRGLADQDAHIAGYCLEHGVATMIIVNKWDAVEKDGRTADQFTKKLYDTWPFLRFAPVLYVSAKTGQRAIKVLETAIKIYHNADYRIPTSEVNRIIGEAVARRPPPASVGRRGRVRYATQVATHPPTFAVFVNEPQLFHFSYRRYLVNQIRRAFDFAGTPIRLYLRKTKDRHDAD